MKKNKIILLLIVFVLSINSTFSQIPYYDAIKLCKLSKNSTTVNAGITEAMEILGKYSNAKELKIVIKEFENNPFIRIETTKDYSEAGSPLNIVKDNFSSIGGLNVTNFAKASSLLLIDMAKEELTIAFFQKFRDVFDKHDELRILFPNTTKELVNLLDYQYTDMLPTLQEAFVKDMKLIPLDMIDLIEKQYGNIPQVQIVLTFYNLMQQMNNLSAATIVDTIPKLLDSINSKFSNNPINASTINVFKLASIFSNSIRDSTKKGLIRKTGYQLKALRIIF